MYVKNSYHKGQSLVEVILALTIFTIGAASVAYLLIISQSSVRLRLERVQATGIAEEGIELASIVAHNNPSELREGSHSLNINNGMVQIDEGGSAYGIFTRTISVSTVASTSKSVTSRVVWNFSGSQQESVEFTRLFTDWNQ